MTEFTVRDSRPEDFPAIAELTTKAFGRPDEAAIIAFQHSGIRSLEFT